MTVRALAFFLALVAAGQAAAQTVVPVRAIRAQSLITADDVSLKEVATPGALGDLAGVVGREARVTLYPGRPILPNQIGTPAIVERNQIVRMVFSGGALSITAEGRALDRAGPGDFVRVMNLASRQIVSGRVSGSGIIEVGQ